MKPSTDTVPAMLTPGEFVIRKDAAEEIGPEKLHMLNNIDRLGQSALLENARSPLGYQEGGQVKSSPMDVLKQVMAQHGGDFDESLYTPEGGRTKLGYAKKYGLSPESVSIDTLSFTNPSQYMFKVSGESPSGQKTTSIEDHISAHFGRGSMYDMLINQWMGSALADDVSKQISDQYGSDLYNLMDAEQEFREKIESSIFPEGVSSRMHDEAKAMVAGGMEPDIDSAFKTLQEIDKNKGAIEELRKAEEKRKIMEALGMNEEEYDAFQEMKARLGRRNYQEGGEVMHSNGEDKLSDVLSLFGEKSQDADGIQQLSALATMQRALDMQKAMATHTMPDGTVMPGATHEEYEAMGMRGGGYVPQYQEGGPVEPPMPTGEEGPQQAPMSSGQQAYYKTPMEQLGMDEFEYSAFIKYGPDLYRYFPQNFKPKEQWTAYDSLVSAGKINPYEVSKDSVNVMTDDQLNELLGQRKPPQ